MHFHKGCKKWYFSDNETFIMMYENHPDVKIWSVRAVSERIHNSSLQHISVTSMLLNRHFLHSLQLSVAAWLWTEMRWILQHTWDAKLCLCLWWRKLCWLTVWGWYDCADRLGFCGMPFIFWRGLLSCNISVVCVLRLCSRWVLFIEPVNLQCWWAVHFYVWGKH
jgi:hypothetical protein